MGMFTTIETPEGWDIQIYTGRDNCERYRVGDEVNWRFHETALEGTLLDGVYPGEAYEWVGGGISNGRYSGKSEKRGDFWVVIKDHMVVAITPIERDANGEYKGGELAQQAFVMARYGVKEPPLDAWSDAAWARHAQQQERSRRRQRQWDAEDYGKSPEQQAREIIGRFTRDKMREEGFFRKLIKPVPLTEGELDRSVPSLPEDIWNCAYPAGIAERIAMQFFTEQIPFWRADRNEEQQARAREILASYPRPMEAILSSYTGAI